MTSAFLTATDTDFYRAEIEKAFPFEVEQHRMKGPHDITTPHFGLFKRDDQSGRLTECVGTACKSGYEPHTREDLTALVEASRNVFDCDVTFKSHFSDGHYLSVQPTDEHRQSIFGTEDNIFPRLMITAGYDGSAFRATLGYYRDACRNLAMLREVANISRAIRHTSGLRDRMDELQADFRQLSGGWQRVIETAQRMEAERTELRDFLARVYGNPDDAQPGRSHTMAVNRISEIFRRVNDERRRTGRERLNLADDNPRVSVWEAFNAVQGYEQHDANRRNKPTAWERMLLANRSDYVRDAETISMEIIRSN